jgi:hypothetical protein
MKTLFLLLIITTSICSYSQTTDTLTKREKDSIGNLLARAQYSNDQLVAAAKMYFTELSNNETKITKHDDDVYKNAITLFVQFLQRTWLIDNKKNPVK